MIEFNSLHFSKLDTSNAVNEWVYDIHKVTYILNCNYV